MRPSIPNHAERIELGGETAWIWETNFDQQIGDKRIRGSGWNILQGHYRVDIENSDRDGQDWHTIDWLDFSPRDAKFAGGLAQNEVGHLGRAEFIEIAAKIVQALRRQDAPLSPP